MSNLNKIGMTKRDYLVEMIRSDLISGKLVVGDRLPGERVLGESYGMSRMTARQGIQSLVGDGILAQIPGKGTYIISTPEMRDSGRGSNSSKNVFVILPGSTFIASEDRGSAVKRGVLESVHDKLDPLGFQISVKYFHTTNGLGKSIRDCLSRSKDVQFVIWYVDSPENRTVLEKLNREYVEYVVVDSHPEDIMCDYAVTDNILGGYMGMEHLCDLGHKKIAYLTFNVSGSSIKDREKGVLRACGELGLDASIIKVPFQCKHKELAAIADKVLKGGFSACFVYSDDMAIELTAHMRKRGVEVPGELSVVGYDNIDMAKYVTPSLTSVVQDFYEMGEKAAELLLAKVIAEDPRLSNVVGVKIEPRLVVRNSSSEYKGVAQSKTTNKKRRVA